MIKNKKIIEIINLNKSYKLFKKNIYRLLDIFVLHKKLYTLNHVLKNISFDVYKGEVLGIIGKNGAGKSTLLKILSGVSTPSSGKIYIKGKIVSLLELGSTFNIELTGFENLKLFFTIMSIHKNQMNKYIEEAIKFADIGEYINYPVKLYSSGMFARLAFAASVQVMPDILILDEVLSVGDIDFQAKSLEKIIELKNKGKTILLVSHSFSAVNTFCDRAIWLKNGKINKIGDPKIITQEYHFDTLGYTSNDEKNYIIKEDTGVIKLNKISINKTLFELNDFFSLNISYTTIKNFSMDLIIEIWKYRSKYPNFLRKGEMLIGKYYSSLHDFNVLKNNKTSFVIKNLKLGSGKYYIDILFSNEINSKLYLHVFNVIKFIVSTKKRTDDGVVLMNVNFKNYIKN